MAPPGWHSDVDVQDDAVSVETAAEAVALTVGMPDEAWQPWRANHGYRRSRLNYGREGQPEMPAAFRKLGEEALEVARRTCPEAPWDAFSLRTLLVNRYYPGDGVAAHQDPDCEDPLVLGVTLYEHPGSLPSAMEFSGIPDKREERLRVQTRHRSMYVFHGRAYRRAKHSRKASKRQTGVVWSFTYRARRV